MEATPKPQTNILQKFWRYSAWDMIAIYLGVLLVYGVFTFGDVSGQLVHALLVILSGIALDYFLHRFQKTGRKGFPVSGLITTLIVLVLLPFDASVLQAVSASVLAILSKHFILYKGKHIFNPAAFGSAVTLLIFGEVLGWRLDALALPVLILGLDNARRVKKFQIVTTFIVASAAMLYFQSGNLPSSLLHSVPWFFVLFMLTEPMTSPAKKWKQVVYAVVVVAAGFIATNISVIAQGGMLWGLLAANLVTSFALKK